MHYKLIRAAPEPSHCVMTTWLWSRDVVVLTASVAVETVATTSGIAVLSPAAPESCDLHLVITWR